MIEINGKVYRNLQEQVYENTLDIDELKAKYGYHGPYDSLEDIENPINLGLYLVGTELPYTLYEYHEITQNWTNLGPYNQRGPQGPQGPQGEQGEKGDTGDPVTITVNGETYSSYMGNITIPDYPTSLNWDSIQDKPNFATVATTGSYTDLANKPTGLSYFTNDMGFINKSVNDLTNYYDKTSIDGIVEDIDEDIALKADASDLADYTKTADLATVALTGDYDDLIDKPDLSIYAESADLATVATTGSYNSLSDKPYIPDYTAGNGIDITNDVISFAAGAMESLQVISDDIWLATREGDTLSYGIYVQKDGQSNKTTTTIAGDTVAITGKDAAFITCYSDTDADVTLQAVYSSGGVYKDAGIHMDADSTASTINLSADRVLANSKEIATTDQIPTNTSDLFNDSGYITGITSSMVTTALGYTPADDADLATVAKTGSYTDLSNTPDLSVYAEASSLGDCAFLDENELSIAYSQVTGTPTNLSDFTNDAGYLTANDIPANIATTDTAQDMTATKTWKAIGSDIKTEVNNAGVAVRNGTSNNVILDNDDLTFTYNNTETVELERTTYKKDTINKISPNNFTIIQKDTISSATTKTYTFDKTKEGTVAVISDIPTAVSELTNDSGFITGVTWNDVTNKPTLATVATTGDYDDLTDKPDLSVYELAADAFSGDYTDLTNKPDLSIYAETSDLATVATTGSYSDLTDKPTIPNVGNGTITIQKNGTAVNTFTTNQSSNKTINITLSEYGLLDASDLILGQS